MTDKSDMMVSGDSAEVIDFLVRLGSQGEVTSHTLWSPYDRHFVGVTRYNALT